MTDTDTAPNALRGAPLFVSTAAVLIAFAANSILCRAALDDGADALLFTVIRILSGAVMLALLVGSRWRHRGPEFDPVAVGALSAYMFGFALAYRELDTGFGALVLFGSVQLTMFAAAMLGGESVSRRAMLGALMAIAGLVGLVSPTSAGAPLVAAGLMAAAGAGWGVYSLRGRGARDPLDASAANFLYASSIAVLAFGYTTFNAPSLDSVWPEPRHLLLALASGALASALGYALWYRVLPHLRVAQAATVQVLVPAVAAWGGVLFVGETLTATLLLWGGVILLGVALVMWPATTPNAEPQKAN